MTYQQFEARAWQIFSGIPPEYREGVDGLEVSRATVPHPSLPEVFTLGECKSEFYPSEYGGAGEVRSVVALYYGSFLELSRRDEEWSWEDELWETVTHEVRHHLESLASEDDLEEMDYAEDQNFARREGEPFDPFFFRSGDPLPGDAWAVDGDVFVEWPVDRRGFEAAPEIVVPWGGRELRFPRPERLGDVHLVTVGDTDDGRGELVVVLVRRRGPWEWVRGLLRSERLEVLETVLGEEGAPEREGEGEGGDRGH